MSGKKESSSHKYLTFDGKRSNFIYWDEKFLAKAEKEELIDVIIGEVKIPACGVDYNTKTDDSGDFTDGPSDSAKEILKNNRAAYSLLVNCINTDTSEGISAFNIVVKTKNPQYPSGNVRQAYLNLKKKYEPTTELDKGNLLRAFYAFELRSGNPPDSYITRLERMRIQLENMGVTIEEDVFLHQIINNLSADYVEIAQNLSTRVGSKIDPLTLEELRDQLTIYYRRKNSSKKPPGRQINRNENAMLAYGSKQYKGKCAKCGRRGHKATECDGDKKPAAKPRFEGKCYVCGKYGHKAADCRMKDQYANVGIAGDPTELAFGAFEAPNDFELLYEKVDTKNEENYAE